MSEKKSVENISWGKFDEFMEKTRKLWDVPGVSVAVVKDNQVVYSKGYGLRDVEKGLPVDENTVFPIGSSTKAFAAFAVGLLVEKGVIEWDKPLKSYMPDFQLYDQFATERMSPRDLLCHRSGLPRHEFVWYESEANREELFNRLRYLKPNKDFRTDFQYQNLMYMTSGYLIERMTGMEWPEFVKQEVLARLSMIASNLSVADSKKLDNYALPYLKGMESKEIKQIDFANLDTIGPAGSINSSAKDMTRWLITNLNNGSIDNEQILSETNMKQLHSLNMVMNNVVFELLTNHPEYNALGYGLGWFIDTYQGKLLVQHGGNIQGFSAQVAMMPEEKLGVCVLTNLDSTFMRDLVPLYIFDHYLGVEEVPWNDRLQETYNEMMGAMLAGKKKSDDKKIANAPLTHPVEDYLGKYQEDGYGIIEFLEKDGKMKCIYNTVEREISHYHYDIFEVTEEDDILEGLKISFLMSPEGRITKVSIPLEPTVDDIVFEKMSDESMQDPKFLAQFVGEYEVMGQRAEVAMKDDLLKLTMPGQPELELVPFEGTTFKVKDVQALSLEFVIENEKVTSVDVNQAGMVISAKKID